MRDNLDATDRGVLYLLQQNARETTTTDIAEQVGVSPSTARNRIDDLVDRGVIKGYVPVVDYENAGFELRILFTCTASRQPTDEFVREILDQHDIVSVRKLLAGDQNLHVEAVGTSTDDVSQIAHTHSRSAAWRSSGQRSSRRRSSSRSTTSVRTSPTMSNSRIGNLILG